MLKDYDCAAWKTMVLISSLVAALLCFLTAPFAFILALVSSISMLDIIFSMVAMSAGVFILIIFGILYINRNV
jgi:hypothetical protein